MLPTNQSYSSGSNTYLPLNEPQQLTDTKDSHCGHSSNGL
uniref:Uncharacterized protein n=1 Tax=Rhizophora mucronata TaxID=61149 RepID=A0A2P2P5K8_RHIMU